MRWFPTGMTYDTMHTPVAPVTSSTLAELSGIASEMARATPKISVVRVRCRPQRNRWAASSTPIAVSNLTSQMSSVWRVGNSIGGSDTARYTAREGFECRSVCEHRTEPKRHPTSLHDWSKVECLGYDEKKAGATLDRIQDSSWLKEGVF